MTTQKKDSSELIYKLTELLSECDGFGDAKKTIIQLITDLKQYLPPIKKTGQIVISYVVNGQIITHAILNPEIIIVNKLDATKVKPKQKLNIDEHAKTWISKHPYNMSMTRNDYHKKYSKGMTENGRQHLCLSKFADIMRGMGFAENSSGKKRVWENIDQSNNSDDSSESDDSDSTSEIGENSDSDSDSDSDSGNELDNTSCDEKAVEQLFEHMNLTMETTKSVKGQVYMLRNPSLPDDVFKVGMSEQLSYNRIKSYGSNTTVYFRVPVINPRRCEKELLKVFNSEFKRYDGLEYFRGDQLKMIKAFKECVESYQKRHPMH